MNEFDSDNSDEEPMQVRGVRPAHKVTRDMGSPVKNQKRGASGSPTKRRWMRNDEMKNNCVEKEQLET